MGDGRPAEQAGWVGTGSLETVRGPVDLADLGVALMHEHVFVLTPDVMQNYGLDMYNPTPDRVATIAALCAQGYADRIVLSQDASCCIDFFSGEAGQAAKEQAAPNWHYEHIHRDVLPALREKGVSEEQITTMLVDNPRRYFTPAKG